MSNLDMSLDDMIKQNKKSRGGGSSDNQSRSRSRNSGPGPSRRLPNRVSNRSTPYASQKVEAPETTWGHDMYEGGHGAAHPARSNRGSSGIETGTKLLITNLDYGVSNEDIKELFAEVGDMKRATVHYDRSGRSKGTAEVVFSRRRDAEMAIKKYDNVQLDGKPMKLELVGTNMGNNGGGPIPNAAGMMYGSQNGAPPRRGGVMGRLRGGARPMRPQGGGGRGGDSGGRGRGRGRGRGGERGEKVSIEDLDADLEKYHAGAMQTD